MHIHSNMYVVLYHMAGNIGVEQNLAVGKINGTPPNFIPPTFNLCKKNSRYLHLILKHVFK